MLNISFTLFTYQNQQLCRVAHTNPRYLKIMSSEKTSYLQPVINGIIKKFGGEVTPENILAINAEIKEAMLVLRITRFYTYLCVFLKEKTNSVIESSSSAGYHRGESHDTRTGAGFRDIGWIENRHISRKEANCIQLFTSSYISYDGGYGDRYSSSHSFETIDINENVLIFETCVSMNDNPKNGNLTPKLHPNEYCLTLGEALVLQAKERLPENKIYSKNVLFVYSTQAQKADTLFRAERFYAIKDKSAGERECYEFIFWQASEDEHKAVFYIAEIFLLRNGETCLGYHCENWWQYNQVAPNTTGWSHDESVLNAPIMDYLDRNANYEKIEDDSEDLHFIVRNCEYRLIDICCLNRNKVFKLKNHYGKAWELEPMINFEPLREHYEDYKLINYNSFLFFCNKEVSAQLDYGTGYWSGEYRRKLKEAIENAFATERERNLLIGFDRTFQNLCNEIAFYDYLQLPYPTKH